MLKRTLQGAAARWPVTLAGLALLILPAGALGAQRDWEAPGWMQRMMNQAPATAQQAMDTPSMRRMMDDPPPGMRRMMDDPPPGMRRMMDGR